MKDKRPVNLDISSIHLPLAAYTSITHRISGVIVFVGVAILLWLFDMSLSSEEGFSQVQALATSPLVKFIIWGILSALAYHMVAGIKHLLMDFGIGESKEAGPRGAKITIAISLLLIIALGVWIW
ncbi:MAG: succinate dehydrogenase, cytochrome b556 subunit [Gammaproteobacteria bacterium]|nr:succinate dehydrogenase, cytochrome b556 subunit [Gammaproteobacteria bacterium]MAY01516.1 succinate dehydrogenase, cytochrome b556 subunit [Gammaproteobacteria bacterium]